MSQPPPGYLRNSQFIPRVTRGEKESVVQMKMKAQSVYLLLAVPCMGAGSASGLVIRLKLPQESVLLF